jgi:glycosyltransferase involved in cell wall biosynthesis
MPFLSCIVLSHDKATYLGEALDSLVAQTFPDWEAVVIDSGVLFDQGFFNRLPAAKDRRIRVLRSGETEELRRAKTIASWCFNECFRKRLIRGEYVTYLCDDDLYYPNAFQTFHDYARANPHALAMYASIDRAGVPASEKPFYFPPLLAEEVKGRCCGGGPLDCRVDSLQLCHKLALLERFPSDEYWPEGREVIRHADGIFLEQIGSLVPVYPVGTKIGQNRKVPLSLNDGGERLEYFGRFYRLDAERVRLERLCREDAAGAPAPREELRRTVAELLCIQKVLTIDGENASRLDKLFRLADESSRLEHDLAQLRPSLDALRAENAVLRQALAGGDVPPGPFGITKPARYRLADKMNQALRRLPLLHRGGKQLLRAGGKVWGWALRRSA